MSLVELSLCLDAYANRNYLEEQRFAMMAWLNAVLQRRKRIPSFERILKGDPSERPAQALPPDEAEVQRTRHEEMIRTMAPDTLEDEDKEDASGGT